jgi:hypothetical protein
MEVEQLPQLILDAEKFTLDNDRMQYRQYFERAEAFCSAGDIVIGGKNGVALLLSRQLTKDSFMWDLYCANTYENAKKLVDALYEVKSNHIDNRTLTLQTNIKHREFTIMIEARHVFKIYALDKYRDVSLVEIMEPHVTKGWFGNQVKVFPPAIVLMDIYQTLYSPAKSKLWASAIDTEGQIIALQSSIIGSADYTGAFDRNIAGDILMRNLLKDRRIVLVGDYACTKLGIGRGSRIQLLTDIPISELSIMTSRILSSEKDQLRRVKVTHERTVHVSYNLNIPSDFQITKYTIYAVVKGEQIALYDVFNSPVYEMIPYTIVDKIQIGCPYVLLRFIYIDIWILKLIIGINARKYGRSEGTESVSTDNAECVNHTESVSTDNAECINHTDGQNPDSQSIEEVVTGSADNGLPSRINSLHLLANSVRSYISTKMQDDPFQIFSRDYIGVNTSETVAKKKIIANIGYRLPNYYPVLNTTGE